MTPAQHSTWLTCQDALREAGVDEETLARMQRATDGRIEASQRDMCSHLDAYVRGTRIPYGDPTQAPAFWQIARALVANSPSLVSLSDDGEAAFLESAAAGCRNCAACGEVPCGACQAGGVCDEMPCHCDDEEHFSQADEESQ